MLGQEDEFYLAEDEWDGLDWKGLGEGKMEGALREERQNGKEKKDKVGNKIP